MYFHYITLLPKMQMFFYFFSFFFHFPFNFVREGVRNAKIAFIFLSLNC